MKNVIRNQKFKQTIKENQTVLKFEIIINTKPVKIDELNYSQVEHCALMEGRRN